MLNPDELAAAERWRVRKTVTAEQYEKDAFVLARLALRLLAADGEKAQAVDLLHRVYGHVGNHAPQRHALPPGLRDDIRDFLNSIAPTKETPHE